MVISAMRGGGTHQEEKETGSSRQRGKRERRVAIIKRAVEEGLLDQVPFKQSPKGSRGVSREDIRGKRWQYVALIGTFTEPLTICQAIVKLACIAHSYGKPSEACGIILCILQLRILGFGAVESHRGLVKTQMAEPDHQSFQFNKSGVQPENFAFLTSSH